MGIVKVVSFEYTRLREGYDKTRNLKVQGEEMDELSSYRKTLI